MGSETAECAPAVSETFQKSGRSSGEKFFLARVTRLGLRIEPAKLRELSRVDRGAIQRAEWPPGLDLIQLLSAPASRRDSHRVSLSCIALRTG